MKKPQKSLGMVPLGKTRNRRMPEDRLEEHHGDLILGGAGEVAQEKPRNFMGKSGV